MSGISGQVNNGRGANMTAAGWNASMSLEELLAASELPEGDRRLRLFNAACARRVGAVMPDDAARRLVDLAEQRADRLLPDADWLRAVFETVDPYIGNEAARDGAGGVTFGILMHLHQTDSRSILRLAESVVEARAYLAYTGGYPTTVGPEEWVREAAEAEVKTLCDLFRCICGNPFSRTAFDPSWRTSTVVSLATGIYADRAFDRMPILADALQETGCENDTVLHHCRDEKQIHSRGCWVIDGILGNR